MLAFRLLADIALRALSPAVNDPATAVDAIEATDGLLRVMARRDIDVRDVTDSAGEILIRLQLPTWDDYLRNTRGGLWCHPPHLSTWCSCGCADFSRTSSNWVPRQPSTSLRGYRTS